MPLTSTNSPEKPGDTRLQPGGSLAATGGPITGNEPPIDHSLWDVYLGTQGTGEVMPFVSTSDGWERYGVSVPSVDTRTVRGMADHVVTSTGELETAFDELTDGETVWVGGQSAPYRTTRWLDIDSSGVTVVGPGIDTAIKPADGANVGGIRIGHNERCHNVTVTDVGYHGNTDNQDKSAKKLHGIIVQDATNVVLSGNAITRTHPFREHGSGGSGISVGRNASNVRITNNRIQQFGDRGIQLGGQNIVVSENVVTDGIDRAIACDLWSPDGKNEVANTVIVTGNILGNCREGSLTGIASGPKGEEAGGSHTIITDNIGFGFHKSFCHVRGPTSVQNVSIRGNVSTQSTEGLETNETTKFAGIAVDPNDGSSITIAGNELSGYSRHGINVQSPITDFKIANNTIVDSNEVGIRVRDATEGTIIDNTVAGPGDRGIFLDHTASISLTNNHIREAAQSGIAVRSPGTTYHEIKDNYVSGVNTDGTDGTPGIRIESSNTGVRGNAIVQLPSPPAIREASGATDNIYENNRAEGADAWAISSPSSIVRDNVPAFDEHRGVQDDDSDGLVRVSFAKRYRNAPKVTFARRGGGVRNVEYETDGDGFVTGAIVDIATAGGTIDVFVEQV